MININKNEVPITLLAIIQTKYHDVDYLNRWAIGMFGKYT